MATKITSEGRVEEFKLASRKLEYLQGLVGGNIEFLTFRDGSAIMVHEEGKLIGLAPNEPATALVMMKGVEDVIVGTAIYFIPAEMKWLDEEEEAESPPMTNVDLSGIIGGIGTSKIEA